MQLVFVITGVLKKPIEAELQSVIKAEKLSSIKMFLQKYTLKMSQRSNKKFIILLI